METRRLPYEILVRFGDDGTFSGAHIAWRVSVIDDDGKMLGEIVTPAASIDQAKADGFPLESVIGQVALDAISQRDALKAQCSEHEKAIQELNEKYEATMRSHETAQSKMRSEFASFMKTSP